MYLLRRAAGSEARSLVWLYAPGRDHGEARWPSVIEGADFVPPGSACALNRPAMAKDRRIPDHGKLFENG